MQPIIAGPVQPASNPSKRKKIDHFTNAKANKLRPLKQKDYLAIIQVLQKKKNNEDAGLPANLTNKGTRKTQFYSLKSDDPSYLLHFPPGMPPKIRLSEEQVIEKCRAEHAPERSHPKYKTFHALMKDKYYGVSRELCCKVVKECATCAAAKKTVPEKAMKQPPRQVLEDSPHIRVQIDLIDFQANPFKWNDRVVYWLMTIIDAHSRYARIYGLESKSSLEIAKALIEHFLRTPVVQIIQSDDETEFGEEMQAHVKSVFPDIRFVHGSRSYHAQNQGKVKYYNGRIKQALRKQLLDQKQLLGSWERVYEEVDLAELIQKAEINHNRSPMEVLGYATPENRHFLVFRSPLLFDEEQTLLQELQPEKTATEPVPLHPPQEKEDEEPEEDNKEPEENNEDEPVENNEDEPEENNDELEEEEQSLENCCNVTTTQLEELRKFQNAYRESQLDIQKKNAMMYAKRINQRDVPAPFPRGTEIVFTPPKRGQCKWGLNFQTKLHGIVKSYDVECQAYTAYISSLNKPMIIHYSHVNKKPVQPSNRLEVNHDLESCPSESIGAETEQEAGGSGMEPLLEEEEEAQKSVLATTDEIEYSDEYLDEYDQEVETEVGEQVITAASGPQNPATSNPKILSTYKAYLQQIKNARNNPDEIRPKRKRNSTPKTDFITYFE